MNAKEAAKSLGVHPETVRRMIREGEIKAEKKGRSFVIPTNEIEVLKLRMNNPLTDYVNELEKENEALKEKLKQIQEVLTGK